MIPILTTTSITATTSTTSPTARLTTITTIYIYSLHVVATSTSGHPQIEEA